MKHTISRYKFPEDEIAELAEYQGVPVEEVQLPDYFSYRNVVFERLETFDIRSGASGVAYRVVRFNDLAPYMKHKHDEIQNNHSYRVRGLRGLQTLLRQDLIRSIDNLFLEKERAGL